MLTHIAPFYLEEGARLFRLKSTAHVVLGPDSLVYAPGDPEQLSMLGMYFANQGLSTFDIHTPINSLSEMEAQEKIDEVDHRLKVCAAQECSK
jgi:hypothetical protein